MHSGTVLRLCRHPFVLPGQAQACYKHDSCPDLWPGQSAERRRVLRARAGYELRVERAEAGVHRGEAGALRGVAVPAVRDEACVLGRQPLRHVGPRAAEYLEQYLRTRKHHVRTTVFKALARTVGHPICLRLYWDLVACLSITHVGFSHADPVCTSCHDRTYRIHMQMARQQRMRLDIYVREPCPHSRRSSRKLCLSRRAHL